LFIEELLFVETSIAEETRDQNIHSNISQQLYMLIQEVQSLKSKTEQLEEEITRLKNR
jgi:hypothetical protein